MIVNIAMRKVRKAFNLSLKSIFDRKGIVTVVPKIIVRNSGRSMTITKITTAIITISTIPRGYPVFPLSFERLNEKCMNFLTCCYISLFLYLVITLLISFKFWVIREANDISFS